MSTLHKRSDSRFWWWSSKVKGKRVRMSTGMSKKSLAERVKDRWDMMVFTGDLSFLKSKALPSSDIRTYMDEYLCVRSRVSENTHDTARAVTARFACFLKTVGIESISELNRKVVDDYIDYLDLAPKTVQNHVKELNAMFKCALADGLLKTNPAKHVTLPKIVKKDIHRTLEPLDLEIIFKDAGSYRLFYEFLYYTGLRAGDVALLRYGDIDRSRKAITCLVRKSDRFHELPLASEIVGKLGKGEKESPIFPTLHSNRSRKLTDNLKKPRLYMQALLGAKGRPKATLHSFRTTFNNTLRDLGLRMDDRQSLMAHSSSETTKIYTHPNFDLARTWIDKMPRFLKEPES